MRKTVSVLLYFLFEMTNVAYAYVICGPAVNGLEIAYGKISSAMTVKETNWMVGYGCVGVVDNIDTDIMCEKPSVVGQARCFINQDGVIDIDYEKQLGPDCMCRRTGIYKNGVIVESVGEWIQWGRLASNNECMERCPRACAETVSYNANKQRNAIMLLPVL